MGRLKPLRRLARLVPMMGFGVVVFVVAFVGIPFAFGVGIANEWEAALLLLFALVVAVVAVRVAFRRGGTADSRRA